MWGGKERARFDAGERFPNRLTKVRGEKIEIIFAMRFKNGGTNTQPGGAVQNLKQPHPGLWDSLTDRARRTLQPRFVLLTTQNIPLQEDCDCASSWGDERSGGERGGGVNEHAISAIRRL